MWKCRREENNKRDARLFPLSWLIYVTLGKSQQTERVGSERGRSSRQAVWGQQRQSKQETWSPWTHWVTLKGGGSLLATDPQPTWDLRDDGKLWHEVLWDQWEAGNPKTAYGLEIRRDHKSGHGGRENICFQSFCSLPCPKRLTLHSGQPVISRSSYSLKYLCFKEDYVKMTSMNHVAFQHSFPDSLCGTSGFAGTIHIHTVSLEYSVTQQKLKTW